MFSLRAFVAIFGTLNLIALALLISTTITSPNSRSSEVLIEEHGDYSKFIDSDLAFNVLSKLDRPISNPEAVVPKETFLGLKRDPEYCTKVRRYFTNSPRYIFEEINFMSDFLSYSLTKSKALPMIGTVVLPQISYELPENVRKKPTFNLCENITSYVTSESIHLKYLIYGTEMGCLTQNYNHIDGKSALNRKDEVARSVYNYTQKFKDKPQCFDGNKFFPRTWLLDNAEQCREWFNIINSAKYEQDKKEKHIVYIRKVGAGGHQGKGVEPVDDKEEASLRKTYKNGAKCGEVKNSYIVQYYIHNPLLVMGHKFDFRVYMLIASTDPLIAYYHDGFLRVSLLEYDASKKEKGMHLTNTAQSLKVIEQAVISGMNETELMDFQMWNYTRLVDYLISEGRIESRAWIDEYLRPAFMNAMQHLIRMTQARFHKHYGTWELFGADFMLDQDLNLWFIECNSGPALKASNKEKEVFLLSMMRDQYEITTGLLRSRIKRVIKYVNWLIKSGLVDVPENDTKKSQITINRFEQRTKEFDELLQNRFDEEFEVSSDNGWYRIVDESIEGLGRYNGNIKIECF